jgi:hypothetical protein
MLGIEYRGSYLGTNSGRLLVSAACISTDASHQSRLDRSADPCLFLVSACIRNAKNFSVDAFRSLRARLRGDSLC